MAAPRPEGEGQYHQDAKREIIIALPCGGKLFEVNTFSDCCSKKNGSLLAPTHLTAIYFTATIPVTLNQRAPLHRNNPGLHHIPNTNITSKEKRDNIQNSGFIKKASSQHIAYKSFHTNHHYIRQNIRITSDGITAANLMALASNQSLVQLGGKKGFS